jgi:hypothetical protein
MYRSNVLVRLHKTRKIEYDKVGKRAHISPTGSEYVETLLILRAWASRNSERRTWIPAPQANSLEDCRRLFASTFDDQDDQHPVERRNPAFHQAVK